MNFLLISPFVALVFIAFPSIARSEPGPCDSVLLPVAREYNSAELNKLSAAEDDAVIAGDLIAAYWPETLLENVFRDRSPEFRRCTGRAG